MTRAPADLIDTDEDDIPRRSVVYFATNGDDFIKIGYSTDVHKRIADLNSASSGRVHLNDYAMGSRQLEKELHRLLASERVKGEWFRQTDKTMDLIYLISDFLETFDDNDEDRDGRDIHVLTIAELHDIMARPYFWCPDAVEAPYEPA